MRQPRAFSTLALALVWACAGETNRSEAERAGSSTTATVASGDATSRAASEVRVALVDSVLEGERGDIGIVLYRVQVMHGGKIDTIPGVTTATLPGVSNDGKVHVLSYRHTNIVDKAAIYDPTTRTLTTFEMPDSVDADGPTLTISPDARHIAYLTFQSSDASTIGIVRTWADGKLVAQTLPEPFFETEVAEDEVRWLDSNHAEFAYRSGRVPNLWIHAVVALDSRGVKVDSLNARPVWKR